MGAGGHRKLRFRCHCWLPFAGLLLAGAVHAPPAEQNGGVLNGRCAYRDEVLRALPDATFVLCSTAEVRRAEPMTTIAFGQDSWGEKARFTGTMAGTRLEVVQAALGKAALTDASGHCEIFYNGGRVSVISCLVRLGPRPIAVNFVASRS